MAVLNCWELMRCGREPEGAKVEELGVCPAAVCHVADGLGGGRYAGRICWAVAGTLCGGRIQGTHAAKIGACQDCAVYKRVRREQAA